MKEEINSGSIKLRPCENGWILSWSSCCTVPGPSGSPYDSRTKYSDDEEVFKAGEGTKALKRMAELYKMSGEEMNEKD